MSARRLAAVVFLGGAVLAGAGAGCAQQTQPEFTFPDRKSFADDKVSAFLELRCGAMDCHGQVGRPLRLYGKYGLRLEGKGTTRSGDDTTNAEVDANYTAVIGLEPEDLSTSVASGAEYVDFMLFKKPLGEEGGGVKHKGGPVLKAASSDPGWVCLRSWVKGQTDRAACERAAAVTTGQPP